MGESVRETFRVPDRTSTSAPQASPADRKWYRNWVIASLLAETLTELAPRFPEPTVDVDAERARLAACVSY